MTARLEVICGPMFSGKSEEMIRRLRREEIAGRTVTVLKPAIDDRYDVEALTSHNGLKFPCRSVKKVDDIPQLTVIGQVIGIDEVQFFDAPASSPWAGHHEYRITEMVEYLALDRIVIVAGLDRTYRGENFGAMGELMAISDRVDKLNAVCHTCGEDAIFTQRLVDGKPAPFAGETVQVGGLDSYEARCRRCFEPAQC